MSTMTATQAARIHERTAQIVTKMRAEADAAENAGDVAGAESLRLIANSRERAGMRAREGARIGRA